MRRFCRSTLSTRTDMSSMVMTSPSRVSGPCDRAKGT